MSKPLALLLLAASLALGGCFAPSVFDTPAQLSASDTSGITTGYTAIVRHQGGWTYDPGAVAAPDGATVVSAQGGGAWLRLLTVGYPGALGIPEWFVDAEIGDDANSCVSPGAAQAPGGNGACADLAEVFRRLSAQQPTSMVTPIIHVRGDLSQKSYVFAQSSAVMPIISGERIYAALDGTPYPTGTIGGYVPWDGTVRQEGVATVSLPGGAPLDLSKYTTANGYWLEVTSGPRAGLGIPIGEVRGAGVFATSGGSIVGSYAAAEPAVGDPVQIYRLTPLATAEGTYVEWSGGPMIVQNLEMGNAQHTVSVANLNGAVNGLELDVCLVHGADLFQGAWLFDYGSVHTDGLRAYGRLVSVASTFDGLQARDNGELELSDNTLVTTNGIWVGGRDGPGYAEIDGPTCVTSPAVPGLRVDDGQLVYLSAPWWVRGATSTTIGADVGPASTVLYDPGMMPSCLGLCAATPWIIGGSAFDSLPAAQNGAGITENN